MSNYVSNKVICPKEVMAKYFFETDPFEEGYTPDDTYVSFWNMFKKEPDSEKYIIDQKLIPFAQGCLWKEQDDGRFALYFETVWDYPIRAILRAIELSHDVEWYLFEESRIYVSRFYWDNGVKEKVFFLEKDYEEWREDNEEYDDSIEYPDDGIWHYLPMSMSPWETWDCSDFLARYASYNHALGEYLHWINVRNDSYDEASVYEHSASAPSTGKETSILSLDLGYIVRAYTANNILDGWVLEVVEPRETEDGQPRIDLVMDDDNIVELKEDEIDKIEILGKLTQEELSSRHREIFINEGPEADLEMYPWERFYPDHCNDSVVEAMGVVNARLVQGAGLKPHELVDALTELSNWNNRMKVLDHLLMDGYDIKESDIVEYFDMEGDDLVLSFMVDSYNGTFGAKTITEFFAQGTCMSLAYLMKRLEPNARFSEDDVLEILNSVDDNQVDGIALLLDRYNPTSMEKDTLIEITEIVPEAALRYAGKYLNLLPPVDRIEVWDEYFNGR